jgi:hypothetical protein
MPCIIVIGEKTALEWVMDNERMAFRNSSRTGPVHSGDPIAIYVTRGAFGNPTRDHSQIIGLGRFASDVQNRQETIGGVTYDKSCALTITDRLEPRQGLPFQPLVEQLGFIRSKRGWATYLRRTLVPISDDDFSTIEKAFKRLTK